MAVTMFLMAYVMFGGIGYLWGFRNGAKRGYIKPSINDIRLKLEMLRHEYVITPAANRRALRRILRQIKRLEKEFFVMCERVIF